MTKRSADTVAGHESVPSGALPFFEPSSKRVRSAGSYGNPPSPSDPMTYEHQTNSSSSDEMSDSGAGDQTDAVSAHHLAACAPSCSWMGGACPPSASAEQVLGALGMSIPPHCPDAKRFLEQLAKCLVDSQLTNHGNLAGHSAIAASMGTALWHAFAELNVILARQFSELPTSMLRGYHSFTRAPRDQLWFRFSQSQGAEMAEESHVGMPRWLALMRFLLEHVLAAYPTASCVMYTIELPSWLRTWCARWGHPASTPLRILAVFAYDAAAAPAPRVLYVPCI